MAQANERGILSDCVIGQNLSQREKFWDLREAISDIMSTLGPIVNFDIGLPLTVMDSFAQKTQQALSTQFQSSKSLFFGHLGDGNLHIIVSTGQKKDAYKIESIIFGLTREMGGTITAEHGIGTIKRDWLSYSRSPQEIDLMGQLKRMMDPANILNPGRVITDM